jgi:hypothetical protein
LGKRKFWRGRRRAVFFPFAMNRRQALKPEFRECIRDAFRKSFGIRALSFALDAPQGAPRQSPMCACSKPLRNPPEANRGFRVELITYFAWRILSREAAT